MLKHRVLSIIGVGAVALGLTGCAVNSHEASLVNPGARHGQGVGSFEVGQTRLTKFVTNCTKSDGAVRATGTEGPNWVTMTVSGRSPSAVLIQHSVDGSILIFQAVKDLRDSSGEAVSRLRITSEGNSYHGSGIFVPTGVNAQGQGAQVHGPPSVAGHFSLTCSDGYGSGEPSATRAKGAHESA